ncbi:sensor histidine kinase [Actinomadura livida]|uniref:histidine kinase n=1 Tax=Actinomadura livida TaxID=79909 RepID=A0A7W7MXT1_9ACTN|nr:MULTISPECIES: HAMP domain-containing sensor histidine kinase [Actinomadura]MBB4774202.1 signal transduction histidine kinase [Actinomadura catellatispora]GGT84191.1 sensor protein CutS [Actinomadura livida]
MRALGRAPALSLRTRLTLVYGSLFLMTSALLVAVTYVLTVRTMDQGLTRSGDVDPEAFSRLQRLAAEGGLASQDGIAQLMALREDADRRLAQQKRDVLEQLLQSSVLLMLVVGVLAVVIGYVVAGRMLRPLHRVTATARRLSESTLHQRIALDGPQDEIKDLADTFDRMLDRLDRAFDGQRRFVANASHELRTPLTINRTVLEVALASRKNPPETKALADVLLGNTARHERLIDGLLTLARSEREPGTRVATPLPDVVRSALDQLDDRAVDAEVDVEARLAPAAVSGDPVLLERCAVNLLENALKYNVRDGRVWVRTGVRDGEAFLQVVNTGRPVPSYEVGSLFEPFRRLRADRTGSRDGAGLGLSIVRAVVNAHGGAIDAVPRPDGGLSITVRLPVSVEPAIDAARPA